ncbi:SH3 and multiple ankyrin repeat domains protein 2-like [Gadus chalcogrammus]|uniref:SH3 and multiple ankyrin repeat domains protein 2-like n=1 Tax=Gadus chalcogrammus TaxID=1042646 RepID=UPI0024C486D1|nr:SH3 and multiple ankyrin repeat domains protein 2-like [Gadus chalcogrammus]
MTCSPTSSEEEMALSLSEGSGAEDSGSSREETRGPGATTVVSSRGDVSRETETSLVICVVIPDLQQSIVLNFESTATIWSAKQQVLCTLTQPLRDVLNYGLFQPAFQGRESGFLDEEQPLRLFSIPKCQGVPTLEFRYKSRVYKHTNVNEMLIAKINIQTNLRRFIECIQQLETDKVEKMLDRGLDPNYHDPENGETPLTLAVQLGAGSSSIIIALKNGGAHMDFRSQDGLTALHKAVKANNHVALKTLLDLGSSVNYKDSQSLTPLYHSVLEGGELSCCLLLLRFSATLGCSDENGWTEMHQACRYGHLKHLEQLLLFGADISSQNATGNTGLHISALHKQEPCVRLLLSIGACKDVKNYRGQTPFQVAITAGNFELADIIKTYKDNENVHLRESPRCASPFRVNHASPSSHWVPSSKQQLETAPVLLRSNSEDNNLDPGPKKSHSSTVVSTPSASPSFTSRRSPSPCHRSSSPTMPSPAVSTVKTVGGVRGGRPSSRSRSPSLGRPAAEDVRRQHQRHTSPHSGGGRAGPEPARHRTREEAEQPRNNTQYSAIPARQFVAITPYHPQAEGEIALCKNDRVKVLCVGEGGYLKGSVRGSVGWFPAECVEEVPTQAQEDRPYTRHDHAERRKLFRNYTVGSYDSFEAASNRIIDEKTVVLQKRDNEGFGFVLRGAKADTPIEEFSPTPAFPALQYLESVDEGGVAWLAGLRTGDFLIKVNQDNVVKVGHKQVVNMIRHGGNRLIIKVVTVSRTLDPEKTNPKKVPPTPRRGPSTLLSMAMRSKSMTSELEELSTLKRKKDDDHAEKPMWDSNRNSTPNVESRKPPPKTRSSSRYSPFNPEMNSIGDIQEVPPPSRAGPTNARAAYLGIPKQGIIRRQKSIGKDSTGVTEEEKTFLSPPMLKLARSLSMPDTSEDIPPPPAVSPPSPPSPSPYTSSHPQAPEPEERVLYGGAVYPRFPQNGAAPGKGGPPAAEKAEDSEDAAWKRNAAGTAQQSFLNRCTPAQIPENPYSDRAKLSSNMGSFSVSKQARKGMLMKQPKVEDKPEKGSSIPIPTIIIKEPSTSSSGKSSQASSMEVEPGSQDLPGQLRPDTAPDTSSVFVVPTIRSRRLADLRNSVSFRSTDLGDEEPAAHAPSRLRQSRSIDEGMLSSDEHFRRLVVNPLSLLNIPDSNGGGAAAGHLMDCNAPEPSMLRAPLSTRTGLHHSQQHQHHLSPLSLPVKTYTPTLSSLSSPASPSMGYGHYLHPVTGKPLDPSSPLALALAARDQAIRGQNQPQPLKTQESSKSDLNMPLFIDTKLARPSAESSFGSATVTPLARTGPRGALRRQMTESKYETDTKYEHPLAKDKKRAEPTQRDEDLSQHKRAGLLMVHTSDRTRRGSSGGLLGGEERGAKNAASKDHSQPASAPPLSHNPSHIHISPHKTFITVSAAEEPVKLPFGMIPPPPLASVDIPEDELFPESLPPPIEFANSFDISESQASSIAELLKQTNNLSSDQALAITEILKQTQNASPGSASAARQSSVSPFYPSYFLPTNSQHEIKCAPAGLTNTMLPIYPEVSLDSFGPVGDSGIEVEVDSRSVGGDPQLETTGTVSNVSSMSTLSSEGGGEGLDPCSVYADGQAFTAAAMINKSNKSTKVKTHNVMLHHRSGKDMGHEGMMAHRDESSYNGGGPPSYVPPPPAPGEGPRTPRDGGEGKLPHMSKAGETRRSRNPDFSSGVPRRNTVTFASTTVLSSLSCQEVITNSSALSGSNQRSPSPSLSPPPDAGHRHPPNTSSSSPSSSALADLYALPPLGSGISRSSSPLLSSPSASSNKPFASKPLVLWSKEDVADWLDHLNLSEHKDAFLDNDIEGSHLPSLQKDDLVDLGVTRVGHRMNIERALKDLMDM